MRIIRLIFVCLLSSQLIGCASIVSGSNQSLSVQTTPVTGARCQLSNDKGTWFIPSTPGSVTVHRAYGDLTVNCKKDTYNGVTKVESRTKGMAFGNIIAGGIVGGAVDMGTGAAYDYPSLVTVDLTKSNA